jgi:hypothetical protein
LLNQLVQAGRTDRELFRQGANRFAGRIRVGGCRRPKRGESLNGPLVVLKLFGCTSVTLSWIRKSFYPFEKTVVVSVHI